MHEDVKHDVEEITELMIKYNSTKFGSYSEKKLSNSTFVERTRLSPILSLSPLFFVKITMSEHVYEMK